VGQGAEARGGARRGGGMISRRLLSKCAMVACCPGARLQTLAASRMDHHHDAPNTLMD